MEYSRKYTFGKVDYNGNGKKDHLVEIEVKLNYKNGLPVFTASGSVWNHIKSDIVQGGQCIDSVWQEFSSQIEMPSLYKEIMGLWKKWHLNDMHAECKHQEAKKMTWSTNPSNKCVRCGWVLGHGWDYRPIDKKDLFKIFNLVGVDYLEAHKLIKKLEGVIK